MNILPPSIHRLPSGIVMAFIIAIGVAVTTARGDTIYLALTNSGTTNGTSWDTAWTTWTTAINDLSNKNASVQGGHTVLVGAGSYPYQLISFRYYHSGTVGNPNLIVTNGLVTLVGNPPMELVNATNITVDGFSYYGNGNGAVVLTSCRNIVIQNSRMCGRGIFEAWSTTPGMSNIFRRCSIYGPRPDVPTLITINGITVVGSATIENCSIMGVFGCGVSGGTVQIKNSIIANCSLSGVYSTATLSNNCFYANGEGNVLSGGVMYDTAAAINALPNCSGNIVANPGFADLPNSWNFNKFYSNSPCLNAGIGGVDLGAYENPPLAATSTNTYYVKTDGNDGADGLSLATAWQSVARAAQTAVAGNTVRVQAGNYTNTVQVTITNAGSEGLPVAYRADGVVVVSNILSLDRVAGIVLDGLECTSPIKFSYSYGNTVSNGAVHNSPTDGIYLDMSTGNTFERMNLYRNVRHGFNTLYRSGSLITRCNIFSNGQHGVALASADWVPLSRSRIYNCNIYDNSSNGVWLGDGSVNVFRQEIVNCDIINNGLHGIEIKDRPNSFANIYNCLLTGNKGGVWENRTAASTAFLSNNCFYANAGTNFWSKGATVRDTQSDINAAAGCGNNIVAEPLAQGPFADGGFRLVEYSPCVNAGVSWPAAITDYYGRAHGFRNGWDIGSAEWYAPAGTIVTAR